MIAIDFFISNSAVFVGNPVLSNVTFLQKPVKSEYFFQTFPDDFSSSGFLFDILSSPPLTNVLF